VAAPHQLLVAAVMAASVFDSRRQLEGLVGATSRSERRGKEQPLVADQAYFVEVLAGACQGSLLAYRSSLPSSSTELREGLREKQWSLEAVVVEQPVAEVPGIPHTLVGHTRGVSARACSQTERTHCWKEHTGSLTVGQLHSCQREHMATLLGCEPG